MCTLCKVANRYYQRQFALGTAFTTESLTRTVFLNTGKLDESGSTVPAGQPSKSTKASD